MAERLFFEAKYPEVQFKLLSKSMERVAGQTPLVLKGGTGTIRKLKIKPTDEIAIFLRIDPPEGARVGSAWDFDVQQLDSNGQLLGGSRYSVVMNRKAG